MRRLLSTRPSPSLVVAMLALFVALGGASYAAVSLPRNSVGTVQLKANAVNTSKVLNHSLLSADFKSGQIPKGPAGPKGATGATGAAGPAGPAGPAGISGLELVSGTVQTGTGNHSATATCPSGKKAISGGYNTSGISGTPTITITQSAVQDSGTTYQVDGRISAGSWNLTARVVCATAS